MVVVEEVEARVGVVAVAEDLEPAVAVEGEVPVDGEADAGVGVAVAQDLERALAVGVDEVGVLGVMTAAVSLI